jgi:hypothetical protein
VLLWLIARVFSSRGDGTNGVMVDADGLWTLRQTSSAELLLKRSYCSSAKVFARVIATVAKSLQGVLITSAIL